MTLEDKEIIKKFKALTQNNIENYNRATRILQPLNDNAIFYSGKVLGRTEYEKLLEQRKVLVKHNLTDELIEVFIYNNQSGN